MPIYIVIQKDHSVRILSMPPGPGSRESGSHCFLTNSDLTISTLRNFLVSMSAYMVCENVNYVSIEGFTLVY